MVLVNSSQKTKISGFTGNNTRYVNAEEEKLVNSIDVYVYDFGSVEIKPDRFMRTRDALIINSDLWGLAWLRPINLVELAKTGDNEKKMLVGEYTLSSVTRPAPARSSICCNRTLYAAGVGRVEVRRPVPGSLPLLGGNRAGRRSFSGHRNG